MKHIKPIEVIFNSLFHCAILFTVISLLFWVYIRKLEEKTLLREIQHNIHNIFTEGLQKDPQMKEKAKVFAIENAVLLNMVSNSYNGLDQCTQDSNEIVQIMNIGFIVMLWITIISTIVIMIMVSCVTREYVIFIGYIFRQNLVIFFFIGLIEFIFFTQVASKYAPIYPSEITSVVVNAAQNAGKSS